jgi:hypothetical protein
VREPEFRWRCWHCPWQATDSEDEELMGYDQILCPRCKTTVVIRRDGIIGFDVTGQAADEVESVTRRLARTLGLATEPHKDDDTDESSGFWTKSRRIGAFVVGLATVAGAVITVLTFLRH